MSIKRALQKVTTFEKRYKRVISRTYAENKGVILQLQKEQLLTGLDSNENELSPRISQDPHWDGKHVKNKSRTIQKYKDIKRINEEQKNSRLYVRRYGVFTEHRGEDTPNLIVTGRYFHNPMRASVQGDVLRIKAHHSKSDRIEKKYPTALGLSRRSQTYFYDKFVADELKELWVKV